MHQTLLTPRAPYAPHVYSEQVLAILAACLCYTRPAGHATK